MQINKLTGKIEAILFASGEPVSKHRIIEVLKITKKEMEYCTKQLEEKYNKDDSGVMLLRLSDDLQLASNPKYIEPVRELLALKRNTPLSPASLEVLALVAYNQPVTKAFIEQVRGVDCSGVISSLIQKGLVEEKGRLELAGRPLLYGTTDNFLRCFSLDDLSMLPEIPDDKKEDEGTDEE